MIDLVMVTAPNPPGSRQLMMPGLAVFEIAPAKVLQGAVRLQGLASSPTPETQVRVACACAGAAWSRIQTPAARMLADSVDLRMLNFLLPVRMISFLSVQLRPSRHFGTIHPPQR